MSKVVSKLTDAEFEADEERKRLAAAELAVKTRPAKHKSFAKTAARVVANQRAERERIDADALQRKAALRAERLAATMPKVVEPDDAPPTVRTIIEMPPQPRGKMVPTPWQEEVLAIPEEWSVLLAGGRGGGKTTVAQMMILRHCEKWKDKARVLLIRETLKSLIEIEDQLQATLSAVYLRGVKSNRAEHTFRLPGGAVIECAPLSDQSDYEKIQGRSFSLIVIEEAGNFRILKWVDLLRSNLRAGNVPTRFVWSANPGGRAHQVIVARFISKAASWTKFDVDGRPWCIAPSTLLDNPHLPATYEGDLYASCGRDRELFRAWRDGSWSISRGAALADVIDESKQMLPGDCGIKLPSDDYRGYLAGDWGLTAPAVCFACARVLRETRRFPRGSLILLDEVSSADRRDESWNTGLQWSPSYFGDRIAEMCDDTGVPRSGVIDDSRGLTESLIEILRKPPNNLYFQTPEKKRREGFAALRELLFNSKEGNGRPGLWASDRCVGFWSTLPTLPFDQTRRDDVDTTGPDHWFDAAKYAASHEPFVVTTGRTRGT